MGGAAVGSIMAGGVVGMMGALGATFEWWCGMMGWGRRI